MSKATEWVARMEMGDLLYAKERCSFSNGDGERFEFEMGQTALVLAKQVIGPQLTIELLIQSMSFLFIVSISEFVTVWAPSSKMSSAV